jgi:glutaredoxin-related protein
MERPKLETNESCPDVNGLCDYIEKLEKYCDWLEDEYSDIEQTQIDLRGSLKYLKRDIKIVLKNLNE